MTQIIRCVVVAVLFHTIPANAFFKGSLSASHVSQSGIVIGDPTMFPFVNFFKEAYGDPAATASGPWVSQIGSNQLPSGAVTTTQGYQVTLPNTYSGKYVLSITGTIAGPGFGIFFPVGVSGQVYSQTNATIFNCSNGNVPPCLFSNGFGAVGANFSVTFDISGSGGGGFQNYTLQFGSGSTWTGVTGVALCKLADYTADNTCNTTAGKTTWPGGFNDDFINSVAALRPADVRFLDVNDAVFRLGGDYAGWPTTSTWSYNLINSHFNTSRWFGTASGSNSYAITCASPCSYALTSGAPVDGDYFHFYATNANTGFNSTLKITDINSVVSAAIPIIPESGQLLSAGVGGTPTTGDTISLTFTTTPQGAFTCLSGGAHTTAAYTVGSGDTVGNIANQLVSIIQADSALSALPSRIYAYNPNGGSGGFAMAYAVNACKVVVTANITGAATETFSVGSSFPGMVSAAKIYTGQYVARLGAIIVNTTYPGSSMGNSWPWITQINLTKALSTKGGYNVACWLQVNVLWSVSSFQSLANLENANQCPGGAIYEVGNELWNPSNSGASAGQIQYLANALGFTQFSAYDYLLLRSRELFGAGSAIYGSIGGHFLPSLMNQLSNSTFNLGPYQGLQLCGTSCSNPAYQLAVGTDYNNTTNGEPYQYLAVTGQAPYYNGSIFSGGNYLSSASYGSWSGTCSISANVLNCPSNPTGTILWNQGIASSICPGVYIAGGPSAQLTGTATTTLSAAVGVNQPSFTVASVTGIQVGMWIYDQTTGVPWGTVGSINTGTKTITPTTVAFGTGYPSAGASDTLVFGGLAGTYQLNNTTCSKTSQTITGGDVAGFQAAADNYNAIGGALGTQQDGFDWLFQDTVVGTINGHMLSQSTVSSMQLSYGLLKGAATTLGLTVRDYEGGFQSVPPNSFQAVAMGLPSSSYVTYASNLENGFKASASFKVLETLRHNQEIAAIPGAWTMWFEYSSSPQWGFLTNGLYSTPWKSYDAIGCYNGNASLC